MRTSTIARTMDLGVCRLADFPLETLQVLFLARKFIQVALE